MLVEHNIRILHPWDFGLLNSAKVRLS